MSTAKPKVYDQAYFDRWYRGKHAQDDKTLGRKAAVAVAIAELHLGRPLRSVLDIGCGEAPWRKASSEAAPRPALPRRGRQRICGAALWQNAQHRIGQSFGQMQQLRIGPPADLLICSDVMHYVPGAELKRGLEGFSELCAGVAYLDVFCREDKITGDFKGFIARSRRQYRNLFAQAGFVALGSHCYLNAQCDSPVSALEFL